MAFASVSSRVALPEEVGAENYCDRTLEIFRGATNLVACALEISRGATNLVAMAFASVSSRVALPKEVGAEKLLRLRSRNPPWRYKFGRYGFRLCIQSCCFARDRINFSI